MTTTDTTGHGAATTTRQDDGRWIAECHDCQWRSEPRPTDTAAENAWYEHAGTTRAPKMHEPYEAAP